MKRSLATTTALLLLFAVVLAGCSSGSGKESATQERFGVRMAKMSLWREAMFRFKRAVEMKPENAMAHNNLAVAYEANGDFDSAAKEYREAIRLDKSNQYIQKNYSRFVEFTSRNKKRQQRRDAARTAEAASSPAAPATTTTAPPVTTTAPAEPAATPPLNPAPSQPPDTSKPPGVPS